MKRLLLTTTALAFAAASTAGAADLPTAPVYKAPVAASFSWTGFYLGASAGMRSTSADLTVDSWLYGGVPDALLQQFSPSHSYDGTAFRFGGYFGYNWQFAPRWLAGIEADVGWADNTVTHTGFFLYGNQNSGGAADSDSTRTTWDASARGRLGYLVTPSTLLYLTGGVAWLHFESSVIGVSGFCAVCGGNFISNSTTKAGWTLGGGIETALWSNWLVRAEYRYADFGSSAYTDTIATKFIVDTFNYDEKIRTHTALLGIAYKFGDPIPVSARDPVSMPLKAPIMVSSYNWSGLYIGVDSGIRSTRTDFTTDAESFLGVPQNLTGFDVTQPLDGTAFRIGGYFGYNWQFAPRWLAGIEADVGWADNTVTSHGEYLPTLGTGVTSDFFGVGTTWDSSLRGRFGYVVMPSTLVYLTGGIAWQHFEVTSVCNDQIFKFNPCVTVASDVTNSATKAGWTLGGGIETALWNNWLARAEYRYADFGRATYTFGALGNLSSATYDVRLRTHTALLGVAYKFDWGSPVVARY